ncbi:transmembrane channel-like protein 6 isoform X2 [Amblyraja radiata]|uniref:transmembrane channel-like protein 6 isoform X2 n=1 Tax=Amblyraja radiata TaxID=386614 RepID=UPI001402A282|nr:transmembrane channel-like protein 6 isoform X2 [Amblyraja radiata]
MACSVDLDSFDHAPEISYDDLASPDSCFDEDVVHDSFAHLLSEQSHQEIEPSEVIELEDLPTVGFENLGYHSTPAQKQEWLEVDCYDPATMKVLAFMPSRTIGRSRGAIISEYYNRTLRLRQKRIRPALKDMPRSMRPSIRDANAVDGNYEEELEKKKLLGELQQMPMNDRIKMLQSMPLNLAMKRELRRMTSYRNVDDGPLETNRLPCWSRAKYSLIIGYFTDTILYYGYYTNNTWTIWKNPGYNNSHINIPYNMPIAYLYTIGTSFFITCIILVHCLSKAFGESYRVGSGYRGLAVKMFSFWDFKVTQKQSIELNHEDISTQLKVSLAELDFRAAHVSFFQWFANLSVHFMGWLLSLGSAAGCAAGVYFYSEKMLEEYSEKIQQGMSEKQAAFSLLILPVLVSAINFVMPYIYNLIGLLETYDFPQQRIYVSIARNLFLKMSIIAMLCFHWIKGNTSTIKEISCWETFVGQELYRLVVVDFIFIILETIFGEYIWRVVCIKLLKRKRKPEFDIARNVLDLIYGQTLTWVGLLFVPLMPAIQIIKFIVVFYIKKLSLMRNCQPPCKIWQASHMMTIFISLLCFPSFLGATLAHLYTVWKVKPSSTCGPYRTLNTIYKSTDIWLQLLKNEKSNFVWFPRMHKFLVENPFLVIVASGILLIVIYFHWQVLDGQRKIIKLLNAQIMNEGDDKKFLIGKLKDFNKKKYKPLKRQMHEETED